MQKIIIAQLNPLVGDIAKNSQMIKDVLLLAQSQHPESLVIFPECIVSGYCPQDLLLRSDFLESCEQAVHDLTKHTKDLTVILGSPMPVKDQISKGMAKNAAIVYQDGVISTEIAKVKLPNSQVFDEQRYFSAGQSYCHISLNNGPTIGILVCEDLWHQDCTKHYQDYPVDFIVSINASPYEEKKQKKRLEICENLQQQLNTPIYYINLCSTQDDLVFDGSSFAVLSPTQIVQLPSFEEGVYCLNPQDDNPLEYCTLKSYHNFFDAPFFHHYPVHESLNTQLQNCYLALIYGLQNYVLNNHFSKVIIGLSGGIDSALTLSIAVDALGCDNVTAIMLRSKYTSQESVMLAQKQTDKLGVCFHNLSIEKSVSEAEDELLIAWKKLPSENAISRQNIQARLRSVYLMAITNQENILLLATGNKSEYSVGYSTLYGDMAGGYAPIIDVYKTLVYQLSRYRNSHTEVIPNEVIEREPTAELAPDQKDSDNLPSYDTLDKILQLFIEEKQSIEQIKQSGIDEAIIKNVVKMVVRNQHKRKQATIGTKITPCPFSRDFRLPISQHFFN